MLVPLQSESSPMRTGHRTYIVALSACIQLHLQLPFSLSKYLFLFTEFRPGHKKNSGLSLRDYHHTEYQTDIV